MTLLSSLALILAMASPAGAGQRIEVERPTPDANVPTEWINETPTAWFVELASEPAVEGTSKSLLRSEKRAFERLATSVGLDYDVRRSFDTLFNGFSINIDPSQLGRLAQIPGVKAIYPVLEVPMPDSSVSGPDLATAIQMTGADIAQSELGLTGAGVKVAVMDTGIDYHHPDLGGGFGDGYRVAYGYDLVGDAYNADPDSPSYDPVPNPDPDPDDCQGHGTHVAGIVGANGEVVGVAPGVTLGAYRVFGCDGSTDTDIMIAAMEMALADGMDVLNMSIGSPYAWPEYPSAMASNYLVDAGMVVVASIGNSGETGTYSAGAPGVGEKVIGTASFDNTVATFPVFEVDGVQIGFNPMAFSADIPTSGTEEIVFVGQGCSGDDYLDDPDGKVALIERGACSFAEKTQRAYDEGAIAAVVHNNAPGNFNGTLGAPPAEPQIALSISQEDGLYIRSLMGTDPVYLTWTEDVAPFPNPSGGLISSFSSWGLTPDLTLKPDIGAPGGSIWSTIPLEQGGYGSKGGTSMASPHVAGAAALLLEARPDTPAALVRDILQNSADPKDLNWLPGLGLWEPVHRQGAGMLDIDDSILSTTTVLPGKLSLGESENAPHIRELTIYNDNAVEMTYDLATELDGFFGCCSAAMGTTGTFIEDLDDLWLTEEIVEFDTPTVTVPAGGSAVVVVTIHPDQFYYDLNMQYGGYITVTPQGTDDVFRVPYAGFIGDYQSIEVLGASAFGVFPALGVTEDGQGFGLVPEGWVYTMEGFDVPNLLLHLQHQSRRLVADVYDADTGQVVHPVFNTGFEEEYLPRNATSGGFFAFAWDGTRLHSNGSKLKLKDVPDGEYYITVRILKALGDADNPDHWETWTTPVFEIDRPNVRPGKKPKMN